jgi:hypothetical protein
MEPPGISTDTTAIGIFIDVAVITVAPPVALFRIRISDRSGTRHIYLLRSIIKSLF